MGKEVACEKHFIFIQTFHACQLVLIVHLAYPSQSKFSNIPMPCKLEERHTFATYVTLLQHLSRDTVLFNYIIKRTLQSKHQSVCASTLPWNYSQKARPPPRAHWPGFLCASNLSTQLQLASPFAQGESQRIKATAQYTQPTCNGGTRFPVVLG